MGNVADPTVVLSMLLNQGSVKAAQDQLVAGIKEGVARTAPEFERIEGYLSKAISKAGIEQQLKKSLDVVSRSMGQTGNFSAAVVAEYGRIEAAARQAGSAFVEEMSKRGGVVAQFGRQQQLGNNSAIYQDQRAAAYNAAIGRIPTYSAGSEDALSDRVAATRLLQKLQKEEFAASSLNKFQTGQWGHSPPSNMMQRLSSWQNSAEQADTAAAKRQSILGYARRYQTEEDRKLVARNGDPLGTYGPAYARLAGTPGTGADPAAHFAGLDLGDQGRRIEAIQRRRIDQLDRRLRGALDDDDFGPSSQDRMDARMSGEPIRGRSSGRRMSNETTHRFRFAAQNVGFGIDDALQSYHYGGVGASIRAASNNVTAIAGMTIPNPVVAAGTVVALSIATAVAPMLLKRMGYDENIVKAYSKAAETRTGGEGSTYGSLVRGKFDSSSIASLGDAALSSFDKLRAEEAKFREASTYLSQEYNNELNPIGQAQRQLKDLSAVELSSHFAENDHAGRARAAQSYKLVTEYGSTQAEEMAKYEFAKARLEFAYNRGGFAQAEQRRKNERLGNIALNQATTSEEYESTLKANARSEIALINSQGHSTNDEKELQRKIVRLQLEEKLSHKDETAEMMADRKIERASYYRNELGIHLSDPISNANSSFLSRTEGYAARLKDGSLLQPQYDHLVQQSREDNLRQKMTGVRDAVNESWGGTDVFTNLRNQRDDRHDSYVRGLKANPDEGPTFERLKKANQEGFEFQTRRAMEDLKSSVKVTSPLGRLAEQQARKAEELQKLFDDNPDMAPGDKAKLEKDFKRHNALLFREVNRPSGTEHFSADSQAEGSRQDRELEARMLGTFVEPNKKTEKEMLQASLAGLKQLLIDLGVTQENLEGVRLGL